MRYKFLMNFFGKKSYFAPLSISSRKLFIPLTFVFFFTITSNVYGQKISLDVKNKTVQQVFKEIENKSSYSFIYAKVQVEKIKPIDLKVENLDIAEVLDALFKNTTLGYTISGKNIIIKEKTTTNNNSEPPGKPFLVTGLVTDEKGKPLEGASVLLIATVKGTQTDKDGRFSISVPAKGGILFFSFVAFEQTQTKVSRATELVIKLNPKSDVKPEEVVVIGYGTVKKSDLTGSVSKIKTEGSEERPVSSVEQLIQGRVSGVEVQSANGGPGAGFSFLIRGGNSTSNNQPLYVIDGYPVDAGTGSLTTGGNGQAIGTPPVNPLASLNPNEIESIEILKDASSTAIYGSRGANGVVLISTKRGKKGRDILEVNYRTDVSRSIKQLAVLNSKDFLNYVAEAVSNPYKTVANPLTAQAIAKDSQITHNWQDEVFRQGISNDLQIGLSGADDKTKYSLIGNYTSIEGIIHNSSMKKGGIRLNLDREVSNKLKLSMNINGSKSTQKGGVNGIATGETSASIITSALLAPPFFIPFDSTGAIIQSGGTTNPLTVTDLVQDVFSNAVFFSNIRATYKIDNYFSVNTNVGGNYTQTTRRTYYPLGTYVGNQANGYAYQNQQNRFNYLGEFTVNYNRRFGIHNINAVVGTTYQQWTSDENATSAQGFPSNYDLGFYGFQQGQISTIPITYHSEYQLSSFLGRVNYTLKDKYFFTLTGRDDGSSRLAPGHQWAFFPSAAFRWSINRESFIKKITWISTLNVRASYGLSGNQTVAIGQTSAQIIPQRTVIGGTILNGQVLNNIANPSLGWENTRQVNFGTEFGILKDKISLEVNLYKKNTSNLLITLPIPTTSGFGILTTNTGEVENKGLEIELNARILEKKFKWNISANISFNTNKMVSMGALGSDGKIFGSNYLGAGNLLGQPIHVTQLGNPIGSFYGYKVRGVYQTAAEVAAGPEASTAHPGDLKFVDVNGDGQLTADDRSIIGNANPKYIFGINNTFEYKNFRLSISIQGHIGNQKANLNRYRLDAMTVVPSNLTNISQASYNGRWTGPGTSNYYPSARAYGSYFNGRFSDFLIEDGSYIRLKSMVLDYNIPLGNFKMIKSVKVFISATNLFTITKYTGYDPEVNTNYNNPLTPGVDNGTYPQVRTFSVGANMKL